jgi:hypothetical protein
MKWGELRAPVGRLLLAASVAALGAGGANAGTILSGLDGWNLDNVQAETIGGEDYSVIYDTVPPAGGDTYGRVLVDEAEGIVAPGIKVMNGSDQGSLGETTLPAYPGQSSLDNTSNCIMASSPTWCDGPRQTGKRWKQQITAADGPMDIVFDVDATDTSDTEYRAFHRLINATGSGLAGFNLELGFGVGDGFVASTAGDGLSLARRDDQNPTQFPFGLFGEDGYEGRIGGFFDPTGRALFDTEFTEDTITTGALRGLYDDFFGPSWMPGDAVPEGVFFDHDDDENTEALVMAWINDEGLWEQRREIVDGEVRPLEALLSDPLTDLTGTSFTNANLEDLPLFSSLALADLEAGVIEDLANLNLNYYLTVGDATNWTTFADGAANFTLRVTALEGAAPVPVPAALPLLAGAVGGLAVMRRRRRPA